MGLRQDLKKMVGHSPEKKTLYINPVQNYANKFLKSKRTILTFFDVMDTYLLIFCLIIVEKIKKIWQSQNSNPGPWDSS